MHNLVAVIGSTTWRVTLRGKTLIDAPASSHRLTAWTAEPMSMPKQSRIGPRHSALFQFDARTLVLELLFELVSFFLGDALLHDLAAGLHQILGFLQT